MASAPDRSASARLASVRLRPAQDLHYSHVADWTSADRDRRPERLPPALSLPRAGPGLAEEHPVGSAPGRDRHGRLRHKQPGRLRDRVAGRHHNVSANGPACCSVRSARLGSRVSSPRPPGSAITGYGATLGPVGEPRHRRKPGQGGGRAEYRRRAGSTGRACAGYRTDHIDSDPTRPRTSARGVPERWANSRSVGTAAEASTANGGADLGPISCRRWRRRAPLPVCR